MIPSNLTRSLHDILFFFSPIMSILVMECIQLFLRAVRFTTFLVYYFMFPVVGMV